MISILKLMLWLLYIIGMIICIICTVYCFFLRNEKTTEVFVITFCLVILTIIFLQAI